MSEGENSPLTEPVVVTSAFLTGCTVEFGNDWARIVAWEQLPAMGGEMVERRIVGRWVMPKAVARDLLAQLRRGLGMRYEERGH
jgi:hypothetical protein